MFDETDRAGDASFAGRASSSMAGSPPSSLREEAGAFGERMKGAAKDATGAVLGDERLEREGERENAEGRRRQAQNDAVGG